MTTIATDGKSMAGDGLIVNAGDMICGFNTVKVHRLDDGGIVGIAGDASLALAFVAWLNGGTEPTVEEVDALHITADGALLYYHNTGAPVPCEAPAAIGTGTKLAMGAMLAGSDPAKAVEIACQRDICSGGSIIVLHHGSEDAAQLAQRFKAVA